MTPWYIHHIEAYMRQHLRIYRVWIGNDVYSAPSQTLYFAPSEGALVERYVKRKYWSEIQWAYVTPMVHRWQEITENECIALLKQGKADTLAWLGRR